MLPQTSSSQFPFNSVSALMLAGPAPPTRVSKSMPPLDASLSAEPFTAVAERSSMRCESRKNWSCSFSTRSPNFLITAINRWNCSTFSTVQDIFRRKWTQNKNQAYKGRWTLPITVGEQGWPLLLCRPLGPSPLARIESPSGDSTWISLSGEKAIQSVPSLPAP